MGALGENDAPAYPGGPCREPALLHLRELCLRPGREDRIGVSMTKLELAAAQEEPSPKWGPLLGARGS